MSICHQSKAQKSLFEDSFTEQTTQEEKFEIYLDSIVKYLYRDVDITSKAFEECQKIIDDNTPLQDSIQLKYITQKIYFAFSNAQPLEAYQIIVDNEYLLESPDVTRRHIGGFNYLKSFTYMSIGDLEAAQNAYYEEIELNKVNKDTSLITGNLYSLGQLFNDEGDYEAALKCYHEAISYLNASPKIRLTTKVLLYIEQGESLINKKEYTKALKALAIAEKECDTNNLGVLKSEILIMKGYMYLESDDIEKAKSIYDEIIALNQGAKDQNSITSAQKLLSGIYRGQERYPEALAIYDKLFSKTDSSDIDNLLELYETKQEVYNEMNDYDSAYENLIKYTDLKDKRDEDLKKQKTAYLKIKYETEKKQKENELLLLKIKQRDSERKSLYGLILFSLLFLAILFGAFYQRMRYSKSLEDQVQKRTEKLKESNELLSKSNMEIDEFNRILSHDLTEPLRSIVGFSQMANRHIAQPEKAKGYLEYVINSGQQLEQLIRDVSTYREAKNSAYNDISECELDGLCRHIIEDIKTQRPGKTFSFQCSELVSFKAPRDLLESILSIVIKNAMTYNRKDLVSIHVDYEQKDNHNFIKITDNGIGIASAYHADIFNRFTRLNPRGQYSGSGLGLSVASMLMDKINGDISLLNSKENSGSTFLLKFPVFS